MLLRSPRSRYPDGSRYKCQPQVSRSVQHQHEVSWRAPNQDKAATLVVSVCCRVVCPGPNDWPHAGHAGVVSGKRGSGRSYSLLLDSPHIVGRYQCEQESSSLLSTIEPRCPHGQMMYVMLSCNKVSSSSAASPPFLHVLKSAPCFFLYGFRRCEGRSPESAGAAFCRCGRTTSRGARHCICAAQPHAQERVLLGPRIFHVRLH
jgi:hypothetical protein